MVVAQLPQFHAQLSIVVEHPDGTIEAERIVSQDTYYTQSQDFWRSLWKGLKEEGQIPAKMAFAGFLQWFFFHQYGIHAPIMFSLVTSAGIAYLTQNFAGTGGVNVSNFVYHETGTNNTASTIAQTDLVAPIALARVAGTNSNPAAGALLSTATISYNGTFTVQEWGLFSAAGTGSPPVGGTLWDRRVVSPSQGVNAGTNVTYNYNATATAGGT